jgi:hypothetical protein
MLETALLLKRLLAPIVIPVALSFAPFRHATGLSAVLNHALAPFRYLFEEPKLTLERYVLFFFLFGLSCIKGLCEIAEASEFSVAYDLVCSALFWGYVALRFKLHRDRILRCPWI